MYPSEEWYSILMLKLCSKIHTYDANKGAFSTWAYRIFKSAIRERCVYNNRQKRKGGLMISLDYVNPKENLYIHEIDNKETLDYSAVVQYEDSVLLETKLIINELENVLSPKLYEAIMLYLNGYNYVEIEKILKLKRGVGYARVKSALDIIKLYYYYEELKTA